MNKQKLRNDILLVLSLLLVAIIAFLWVYAANSKSGNIAKVYVRDEIVYTIDLSDKKEKDYPVHGINGDLVVHTKDGKIAVIKSNCPHQDCVHMGYINQPGTPIICAYNAVSIVIEGDAEYDVVI